MTAWDVISMLFPIILIIGLLLAALYFVKRKQLKIGGNSDLFNVRVLFTKSIMPKKYISFVRIGDKIMVLGVSDNSISVLKELDWDESYSTDSGNTAKSFYELFKDNLKGK